MLEDKIDFQAGVRAPMIDPIGAEDLKRLFRCPFGLQAEPILTAAKVGRAKVLRFARPTSVSWISENESLSRIFNEF